MESFDCYICSKEFSRKDNLGRHINSVHKQYLCRGQHRRRTTAPMCPYCKQTFSRDDSLSRHIYNFCSKLKKHSYKKRKDFMLH